MHVPAPTAPRTSFLATISTSLDSDDLRQRLTAALNAEYRIKLVEFVPEDMEDTVIVRTSQRLGSQERRDAFEFCRGFLAGYVIHLTP